MKRSAAATVRVVLSAAYVALIFVAAGTTAWPRLWLYLGFYVVTTSGLMLWLKKRDPGLLKERMTVRKDVRSWDKIIIRAYTVLLAIMFPVAAIDAVRFHWSHVPAAVSWPAFAGLVVSWALVLWAFRENAFLSGYFRIQGDRGHKVCTTGPYLFVRHPMYLAVILSALCLPLFLGSFYALIPAALVAALFVLRTSLEDRALHKELPGYAEYAAEIRWKLVPNVW